VIALVVDPLDVVLEKPVSQSKLLRTVRDVLDRARDDSSRLAERGAP